VALTALVAANTLFAEIPIAPPEADWTHDAPGVRHKFSVDDLTIGEYASGFSYPRYLLAGPNGDIFVTESRDSRRWGIWVALANRAPARLHSSLLPRVLDEQLVREDAEAIDRRGLNAQNDRAERDRAAAMATREGKLGRREIAFGTDQHEDARGAIAMFG
jgi:hypothetical protein